MLESCRNFGKEIGKSNVGSYGNNVSPKRSMGLLFYFIFLCPVRKITGLSQRLFFNEN